MALLYNKSFKLSNKDELKKSTVRPTEEVSFVDNQINKNKVMFGLQNIQSYDNNLITKSRRLSDDDLLLFSQADSVVSLIVSTRCNQAAAFGVRAHKKYEQGIMIRDLQTSRSKLKLTPEEIAEDIAFKDELTKNIYNWILQCGTNNNMVKNAVFRHSDSYFKNCSLKEFIGAQTRNLLVCGRMATQLIRNEDGRIIMFRPVPVETIFSYRQGHDISISTSDKNIPEQVKIDAEIYHSIPVHLRPQAWVQRIDGKICAFFTERDLRLDYLQKQANAGLNTYPLAPLELAINALQLHMSAQQYMNNSFTKGLGSKGFISIKPTEGSEIDDIMNGSEMEALRKEFQNYIAGSYNNSAVIPIISGPVDVKFTSLNATAKDMEFLNLYNYVIAILCASFQIAPEEVGFNGTGTKTSLGDEGSQSQIVQGQERGLKQIMSIMCGFLTDIVAEVFDQAKDAYSIDVIGLGQNTQAADLGIYKEQLQTDGTFSRIWADSEHPETFPFGGDVPTSPLFHQGPRGGMKMSEYRYHFYKDENALNNPDYDFFLDPVFQNAYYQQKTLSVELLRLQNEAMIKQLQSQGSVSVSEGTQKNETTTADKLLDDAGIHSSDHIDSKTAEDILDSASGKLSANDINSMINALDDNKDNKKSNSTDSMISLAREVTPYI
jgi:hypothetical protein